MSRNLCSVSSLPTTQWSRLQYPIEYDRSEALSLLDSVRKHCSFCFGFCLSYHWLGGEGGVSHHAMVSPTETTGQEPLFKLSERSSGTSWQLNVPSFKKHPASITNLATLNVWMSGTVRENTCLCYSATDNCMYSHSILTTVVHFLVMLGQLLVTLTSHWHRAALPTRSKSVATVFGFSL